MMPGENDRFDASELIPGHYANYSSEKAKLEDELKAKLGALMQRKEATDPMRQRAESAEARAERERRHRKWALKQARFQSNAAFVASMNAEGRAEALEVELGRMTANAEIERLDKKKAGAEVQRLRELLIEWRNTPFFQDEESWRKWVQDFGPRVDAALTPPESPAQGREEEGK